MSTKTKDLADYDLDVFNALKGFPKDETNCFFYMRGNNEGEESHSQIQGTHENLGQMLIAAMKSSEDVKNLITNAFINYLLEDKNLCKKVKGILKKF